MKTIGLTLCVTLCAVAGFAQIDSTALPQVFAPGIVSTPYEEWATSFSPDGRTVYWSQGAVYWTICASERTGDTWSKPWVLPFSGAWNDTDPFVSPDGQRLFFISNRPLNKATGQTARKVFHIWYVDRLPAGDWSEPHHLNAPVNEEGVSNYAPCVTRSGDIYFCSRDRDGHNGMNGFCARWLGKGFDTPRLVSPAGVDGVQDPFVSADGRYMVFVNGNDLFLSYRQGTDWSAAQKFGPQVNDGDGVSSPYVSPDGSRLYYSSNRVRGLYKRDRDHALDYEGLTRELQSPLNGSGNILVIPVHLPAAT
jgi:hypothetical protein